MNVPPPGPGRFRQPPPQIPPFFPPPRHPPTAHSSFSSPPVALPGFSQPPPSSTHLFTPAPVSTFHVASTAFVMQLPPPSSTYSAPPTAQATPLHTAYTPPPTYQVPTMPNLSVPPPSQGPSQVPSAKIRPDFSHIRPNYAKELDFLLPTKPREKSRDRRRSPSPTRRHSSYDRRSRRSPPRRRHSPSSRSSSSSDRRRSSPKRRPSSRDRRLESRRDRNDRDEKKNGSRSESVQLPKKIQTVSQHQTTSSSESTHAKTQTAVGSAVIKTEPEDRPSSPHSASSSTNSCPAKPLSPARGPSRRPSTPSATTNNSEKSESGPAKDSDPIENSADFKCLRMTLDEVIDEELKVWTRSAPADLYYERDMSNPRVMKATPRLKKMLDRFEEEIVSKHDAASTKLQNSYKPPKPPVLIHRKGCCSREDSSSSDSEEEDEFKMDSAKNDSIEWMEHRASQSFRLHRELWDNRPQELNDGPVCRCSQKSQKFGIRHGIFPGEDAPLPELNPETNNADRLYHYRVTISPPTNFLMKQPTVIRHDHHDFAFEGFSLFTTEPLKELPVCHVVRFSIKYSILYFEEKYPENVTLRELQLFDRFFFQNLLELVDWDVKGRFFFMPRFVRDLSENGKEILSMNEVISHLLKSYQPIIDEMELSQVLHLSRLDWQRQVTDPLKGMIVTNPSMAPAALRVDQLDREQDDPGVLKFPEIVHFGTRPQQLCYAGSAEYQKTFKEYAKYRHLLANMAKPTYKDKRQLEELEEKLNVLRANNTMKRDIDITFSCQGFFKTGLMTDIVQHGLLLPVLVHHLRLHAALDHFERQIGYTFKNRSLLQLAMTHPSYKENFGTNPDHVRNTLTNCGMRQPEYGDKRAQSSVTRKRGINVLISIMSRFGKTCETESKVAHNERLEFLGDAVVEFVSSVHLFHMFPDLEEGGLATYRAALVQNQHLAVLAEVLGLEHYMLYAHGSDLCHDAEMKHAMANCFEALMGAIYLDSDINEADKIFSKALFGSDEELYNVWVKLDGHPLQLQEPEGDRHWISAYPVLKKLVEFEDNCGIEFRHIRLLARALSDRSLGNSNLTLGSNQRLEFLGDTVLQLVTSDYLYRHFPEHHEGHLSLLRSALVSNRTQAIVCDDLGIPKYAMFATNSKKELKTKDRADLLEAFLGALYIDKDLEYCRLFAEVCFFPRLHQFIVNQEWNDPKSKLQQCCLTLRTMDGRDPDIPVYKVIAAKGPTNTRVFSVAVYFRGRRLATAEGSSIQQAEMAAAKKALDECGYLFPHLNYQKKIVEKSLQRQSKDDLRKAWLEQTRLERKRLGLDEINEECRRRNAERAAREEKSRSAAIGRRSASHSERRTKERRSMLSPPPRSPNPIRKRVHDTSRTVPKSPSAGSKRRHRTPPRERRSLHRSPSPAPRYSVKAEGFPPPSSTQPSPTRSPIIEQVSCSSTPANLVQIKLEPESLTRKRKRDEPLEDGECSDDSS